MTSCSTSPSTHWRCRNSGPNGCRRAQPASKLLRTLRDQARASGSTIAKLGTNGRNQEQTSSHTAKDFNEWGRDYLAQFEGEATVLKFLKEPKTSREVRNLAFAYFTPEEFPTHRRLQELMMLDPVGSERDQIIEIATLILPWCRDGNYGCLFDGTSNLSLTGKIAHFELGYIPESAKELKTAAGFLITNDARKHIITIPRALRKRNVWAREVARFLDIPGGQEIVQESYAQLRKFNCWNISIVQQYARFKQSRIRSAVFGNSRQFFIMRQNDRADLDDIGKDIALPEVTQHAIMNYPHPDHQSGQKYSPFTYFHTDSGRNLCGTVRITSPRARCSIAAPPAANAFRQTRPRVAPESQHRPKASSLYARFTHSMKPTRESPTDGIRHAGRFADA